MTDRWLRLNGRLCRRLCCRLCFQSCFRLCLRSRLGKQLDALAALALQSGGCQEVGRDQGNAQDPAAHFQDYPARTAGDRRAAVRVTGFSGQVRGGPVHCGVFLCKLKQVTNMRPGSFPVCSQPHDPAAQGGAGRFWPNEAGDPGSPGPNALQAGDPGRIVPLASPQ